MLKTIINGNASRHIGVYQEELNRQMYKVSDQNASSIMQ